MQKIKVGIGGRDEEIPSGFFFWTGSRDEGWKFSALDANFPCSLRPATLCLQGSQAAGTHGQLTWAAQGAGANPPLTL